MAQRTNTSILLIAGDVSGDQNTARLAKVLRERHPDWALHAIGGADLGGEALKSPGGQWLGDTSDMSGIGISASIQKFPRAVVLSHKLKQFVRKRGTDAVVLCDWGAFNCGHLKFFKKQGVPVLYYFPPSSWRRTGSGGVGIAPLVDRVATPFEWSAQRLIAAGCKAEWVGHPMLELKYGAERRAELRAEFGIAKDEKLVALMPGSRMPEINCLGPRLAAATKILSARENMRFIVAASARRAAAVKKHFPESVQIVTNRTADVLFACDAAAVKSGTSTLEAAVIGAPQAIVYDFPWIGRIEWVLLYILQKRAPTFIGMPNVILQRMAVPELTGLKCTPEIIAGTVAELLESEPKRRQMEADYEEVRRRLGKSLPKTATLRTAEILDELLDEKRNPIAQA